MIQVGVILAAGRSSRYGPENKLLAPFRGKPLAAHCAGAMRQARLDHRIAVIADPRVAPLFSGFLIERLGKTDAPQSESLKQGVRAAQALGADRILIALADMPLISSDTLDRVVQACTGGSASSVTDGDRRMPPACFPQRLFSELEQLSGDRGAGSILRDIPPEALVVVKKALLADVDTREDMEVLTIS